MTARFTCTSLTGGRGAATAFRDVDFTVDSGQVLTLLGPNGAGKTTLLLTLAGLLPARKGSVAVDGVVLRNGRPALANRSGIVLVPDNRSLFTTMSVAENLRVAARRHGPPPRDMLAVFPALEKRWDLRAGALSGGEQQMLAMARALIQEPKVLLVDELSMGLAPLVVEALFDAVRRIASEHGCAVVLVEQHVNLALGVADHVAVLNHGSVVMSADGHTVRADPDQLEQAYFGTSVSTTRSTGGAPAG
jgi:branched-chain amino acid transport system ATP-binding protein